MAGQTFDCLPVAVAATQINAILPSTVLVGPASLTVTYDGATSQPAPFEVRRTSAGFFSLTQDGRGPGVFQSVVGDAPPLNGFLATAPPRQTVVAWGTGFGPVRDDRVAPTPGPVATDLEVYVGGRSAPVLYQGRSGCCAGIDQLVFTVPDGVEGCEVPVIVVASGIAANTTTISIERNEATCADPRGLDASAIERLARGGTLGVITLQRRASGPGLGFDLPGRWCRTPPGPVSIAYPAFKRSTHRPPALRVLVSQARLP